MRVYLRVCALYNGKQFTAVGDISGAGVSVEMYQTLDSSRVKWPVREREWKKDEREEEGFADSLGKKADCLVLSD